MTYKSLNIYDAKTGRFNLGNISVKDGRITDSISDSADSSYEGLYAIPGFVDVHTHGGIKLAFENASVSEIIEMLKFYAEHGTLYVMPTIGTVAFDAISSAVDNILAAVKMCEDSNIDCAKVIGIHFECRYLNPIRAGAHSPELLVAPNISEADGFIDRIYAFADRLGRTLHVHFTIAPELEGGNDFIKHVTKRGATVGIGHSDADFSQAEEAVNAGAVSFTHLFNAVRPINHRSSSAVVSALTGGAFTELICDGKHLLPETVKLIKTAKSDDKVVLISDSVAAGVPEGESFTFFSGLKATIKDGIAVLDGGTIGGSAVVMQKAAKNYMDFTGATLTQALMAGISNPLSMVASLSSYGKLQDGQPANFIIVDNELNIIDIFVNGNKITHSEVK